VNTCSALNNEGVESTWAAVQEFKEALTQSGELDSLRAKQARAWMWAETAESLIADLKSHPSIKALVPELERAVLAGELPAIVAAQRLIMHYKSAE
jgi:LAO/AO transport system kinase